MRPARGERERSMYKSCKTAQSPEPQRPIVSCLLEILPAPRCDQITVQDLCQKAGVPRKSFYRYFECKQDVLLAAIDFYIQDYEAFSLPDMGPGIPRTTQKEFERFLTYTKQNRGYFEALTRNDLLGYAISLLAENSRMTNAARRLMLNADDETIYRIKNAFVCYGIYSVVSVWVADGCKESVADMARILTQIMTEPLYRALDAGNQSP